MKKFLGIFAGFLLFLVLIFSILVLNNQLFRDEPLTVQPAGRAGRIAPLSWETQKKQSMAQTSEGEFRILECITTPTGGFFIYSMKASQSGIPQIVATSLHSLDTGAEISNTLTILNNQALGRLDQYDLGIIQVDLPNQPKQVISLQITPPGKNNVIWQVKPLKQGATDLSNHERAYTTFSTTSSPLQLIMSSTGDELNYATFSLSPGRPLSSANLSPLFFTLTEKGTILTLTEAEYKKIIISPPTPTPDKRGYYATPAPPAPDRD